MDQMSRVDPRRGIALHLFRAALSAVDARSLLRSTVTRDGNEAHFLLPDGEIRLFLPLRVIGAGKAAAAMADGCHRSLGNRISGAVVVSDGPAPVVPSIEVMPAGHPLPDARGILAARRIIEIAGKPHTGGTLFLLSGGASSLLVAPRGDLTLEHKVATTRLLLKCGADVRELNTVRKHLSRIKGGGLLRTIGGDTLTLAISDVIGDAPEVIGSGPTVPDPTTFADVEDIFTRYGLHRDLPPAVTTLVRRGLDGGEPETLKADDPVARHSLYRIIASNQTAIAAVAEAARAQGRIVRLLDGPLSGDTTVAAHAFAHAIVDLAANTNGRPVCFIAGGETTVVVHGAGRGGRNQEFALAMAELLHGVDVSVLSIGTDGIDGPTDAAGAFVDGSTAARGRQRGISPEAALHRNDSYHFFDAIGDLVRIGATQTNVMDLKIALIH